MHLLFVFLLALYIGLSIFDYISTMRLVAKSKNTYDPVMAAARGYIGSMWWITGLFFIPVVFVILVINSDTLGALISGVLCLWYGSIVYRNYKNLWAR